MARQNTPRGIAPLDWALFNQAEARRPRYPTPVENDTAPSSSELRSALQVTEDPIALSHLLTAVQRAANDLWGQGERSDRIANQLFTALAEFERDR